MPKNFMQFLLLATKYFIYENGESKAQGERERERELSLVLLPGVSNVSQSSFLTFI